MPEPPTDEPGEEPQNAPQQPEYRDQIVEVIDTEVACKMREYGAVGQLLGLEFQNMGSEPWPAGSQVSLTMPDGSIQNYFIELDTPVGWYLTIPDVFEGAFPE